MARGRTLRPLVILLGVTFVKPPLNLVGGAPPNLRRPHPWTLNSVPCLRRLPLFAPCKCLHTTLVDFVVAGGNSGFRTGGLAYGPLDAQPGAPEHEHDDFPNTWFLTYRSMLTPPGPPTRTLNLASGCFADAAHGCEYALS